MAKNHYINNKDFLKEMIKYRTAIRKAKRLGQPKPQIPTYVAKCFMMIAENLSHKPNFLSYGWYPIFVYKKGIWYQIVDSYSSSTGRQISNSNPNHWKAYNKNVESDVYLAIDTSLNALNNLMDRDILLNRHTHTVANRNAIGVKQEVLGIYRRNLDRNSLSLQHSNSRLPHLVRNWLS